MIYKKIKIENFKGIKDVTLDLTNNRVITLVGLNESGKTSIMEAIQCFYSAMKFNEPNGDVLKQIRPKGTSFTGKIKLQAELEFEPDDIRLLQEYWEAQGQNTKLEIPSYFDYTFSFDYEMHSFKAIARTCTFYIKSNGIYVHTVNKELWDSLIYYIRQSIIPEIIYYDDFVFETPDQIVFAKDSSLFSDVKDDVFEKNNKWMLVLEDILKAVDSRMSFKTHIVDIWDTDKDTAEQRISQLEVILNEKITKGWKGLFSENNGSLNFNEIKLKCEPNTVGLAFSFHVKTDSGKLFSINERSKGCKWFFSFLIYTEFRKNRSNNILFLLDEPASNLHSSAQKKILGAINTLSDRAQVIYSTHSHHLINIGWLRGAYIVINEGLTSDVLEGNISLDNDAKITVKRYFTYVGEGFGNDRISYFQPILDALDYQPSFIEPIPNIIILEGKNDWYTFNYFFNYILNTPQKLNFYPGAGCDKLGEIIRLYLSWGKDFLVLLDGDMPGIKAKEYYQKEFDGMIKGKILTLKDITKKTSTTEDLIEEGDRILIHDTVFGKGSYIGLRSDAKKKVNLNSAIVHLFSQSIKVAISEKTKNNFKKAFEAIRPINNEKIAKKEVLN